MPTFTSVKKQLSELEKLTWFASSVQMEADKISIDYLNLHKLALVSDIFDFNILTIPKLMPLFINQMSIDFLIKNCDQVGRKFSIIDLIEYGKMYKLTKLILKREPKDLKELKNIYLKIKPACNK